MSAFIAYTVSTFLFFLFVVSVVMILSGDKHTTKHPIAHLFITIGFGAGAYFAALMGGI